MCQTDLVKLTILMNNNIHTRMHHRVQHAPLTMLVYGVTIQCMLYNIYYVSRSRMYLRACQRTISFDVSSRATTSAAYMHFKKIFYCKTNIRGEHFSYPISLFFLKFWFLELSRLLKGHNTHVVFESFF